MTFFRNLAEPHLINAMTPNKLSHDTLLNPWLKESVKKLKKQFPDVILQEAYEKVRELKDSLTWEEFLIWKALKEAANTFLQTFRLDMDLSNEIRRWLYLNHVDTAIDLIQITDNELKAITTGHESYYEQITAYLHNNGYKLYNCNKRTVKVSSNCLAEIPAPLILWMVAPHGNVRTFNPDRPTLYSDWFDEWYLRYERIPHEEELCPILVSITAGNQNGIKSEIKELFSSLRNLRDSYNSICDKYHTTTVIQEYRIPDDDEELLVFPLHRFIDLKKDALRNLIRCLEEMRLQCSFSIKEYFEAEDTGKLDIAEKEKNALIQSMLIAHVSLRIDFDNLIHGLKHYFNPKHEPCPEWPVNPWLEERIMQFRKQHNDSIRSEYRSYTETKACSWVDYIIKQALAEAIRQNPSLMTPLYGMPFEHKYKKLLASQGIRTMADLAQLTDMDLNLLFEHDMYMTSQITDYLSNNSLKLYHSNILTFKYHPHKHP